MAAISVKILSGAFALTPLENHNVDAGYITKLSPQSSPKINLDVTTL